MTLSPRTSRWRSTADLPAPLAALAPWAVAAGLVAYTLYATVDWDLPWSGGPSFGPVWIVATTLAIAGWSATGRRPRALAAVAIGTVTAMLLTDVAYLASGRELRDLDIYLRAGDQFAAGAPVYLDHVLMERPDEPPGYPFLYPPVTLPLFAGLGALPDAVARTGWVAGSVGAAVAALRLFGLPWRWVAVLLAWPPVFQGIQVGNVAVLVALLFAAAPRWPAGLVLAPIFKIYSGLAAAWLVREGRWRALAAGIAIVAGACLATLPLTGPGRWAEWWRGLDLFRASQPFLPASLYGFGLLFFVPGWAAIAAAGAVFAAAVHTAGRSGLARLGLATAVASPSLYSHGLIMGLPALLELRAIALWGALAITAVSPGLGWWLAIGLTVVAWFVPTLRRDPAAAGEGAEWHPLPTGIGPWGRLVPGSSQAVRRGPLSSVPAPSSDVGSRPRDPSRSPRNSSWTSVDREKPARP